LFAAWLNLFGWLLFSRQSKAPPANNDP